MASDAPSGEKASQVEAPSEGGLATGQGRPRADGRSAARPPPRLVEVKATSYLSQSRPGRYPAFAAAASGPNVTRSFSAILAPLGHVAR